MLVQQIDAVSAEALSDAVDGFFMCSGRLFRPPVPPSMSKPNFVAVRTLSRTGASASPTSSSLVSGPHGSARIEERDGSLIGFAQEGNALASFLRAAHNQR